MPISHSMARHVTCLPCVLCLAVLAVPGLYGQAGPQAALSAGDQDLVRLVLALSSQERAGWSAEVAVLLDSTPVICEGPPLRGCLSIVGLDDLARPGTIALMTPECARTDYRALRDSFVARNRRSLQLGPSAMGFPMVPGAEARALSADARRDRFGDRWFIEVSTPAYSPDGQSALVYVQAYPAFDGLWASIRVFEQRDRQWTPTRCGLNLTA